MPDPAQCIRAALSQVESLRLAQRAEPGLAKAVGQVKQLQNRRFAGSYCDLMADRTYEPASRFFLDELYSDRDYADRDAQFARIAGALQKMFPSKLVGTAVALAELHALSETLDDAMARSFNGKIAGGEAAAYVAAWRAVGRKPDRDAQLRVVLGIGKDLDRLTRTPGLRLMLKMMRGAAQSAGMGDLQRFLETGFDTFAAMSKAKGGQGSADFLALIQEREAALIDVLFNAPPAQAAAQFQGFVDQGRSHG